METDLLKTFTVVAEARSFSAAAAILHSTQPTVSRQIGRLESRLGVNLFERYGRHVECTAAGELLLPLAQVIVSRADDAISLLQEQAGKHPAVVRFGSFPTVTANLLAPTLAGFFEAYPAVPVDLVEKDDATVEDAVVDGELDCGVMCSWGPSRAAVHHLLTEEILLVVPFNHRLAKLPAVSLDMISKENLLLPRVTLNVGNVILEAFRRADLTPRLVRRYNYPELAKALVRRRLGLAPMVKNLCSPIHLEGLVAIPFEEPITRDLVIIYPGDRPMSDSTKAFMVYLRSHIREHIALGQPPGAQRRLARDRRNQS